MQKNLVSVRLSTHVITAKARPAFTSLSQLRSQTSPAPRSPIGSAGIADNFLSRFIRLREKGERSVLGTIPDLSPFSLKRMKGLKKLSAIPAEPIGERGAGDVCE